MFNFSFSISISVDSRQFTACEFKYYNDSGKCLSQININ